MNIASFIKDNFVRLLIQILFIGTLLISVFFMEYSIEAMKSDGRSVNYVGIIRGGTQRLIKQELNHQTNDELIDTLDSIIFKLKIYDGNNRFATHENEKLQQLLLEVESLWIELKEEIYIYRESLDSKRLFDLSEDYYELTNTLVFETQVFVESKVDRLISLRRRLLINVILIFVFSIYQIISKIRLNNANNKLNNIAYIDSLTGLSNRAHCNEIINNYNEMNTLPDLVCVYFDLNNLKVTNDLLGHEAGDKLLRDFGKILKEASEPYGFICRNGGDEFVSIFENCNLKNVTDYINFINEKTNAYNSTGSEIQISFAVGYAFSNEVHTNRINEILTLADKRMYENKAEYKRKKMQEDSKNNK